MTPFGVGVMDVASVAAQPAPDLIARAGYLATAADRIDSNRIPDHINGLIPRALWTRKYLGAVRLVARADAYAEPWTLLGNIAARNRLGRLRLGVGVTDASRRNPAVTAQAVATVHPPHARPRDSGHRAREREGNEPYGV